MRPFSASQHQLDWALGVDGTVTDVAEFGCCYGIFTVPVATLISGNVYTIDIAPEMINAVRKRAQRSGLTNMCSFS